MKPLIDIKKTVHHILSNRLVRCKPLHDLSSSVIVISGASEGLGYEVGKYLVGEGATVIFLSRNILSKTSKFENLPKNKYKLIECDITNFIEISNVVDAVQNEYGRIDVLINNAGVFERQKFDILESTDIDKSIKTNINGCVYFSRAVVPIMKKQKSGLIINLGSKISHNTAIESGKVLYATTKYAIEGFSFALNKELKPYGVRVTCLMPGTINTFISRKSGNYLSPGRIAQLISMIISFDDVDFEGVIVKSVNQDI